MKKRSFILIVLMLFCSIFCLVGCGADGKDGAQGAQGEKGETGAQGPQGPQGIQGPQGEAGEDGEDGKDGKPGAQGPQGIQGIQGEQGPQGEAGKDGREVVFNVTAEGIFWQYAGDTEWTLLISFVDLEGYQSTYTITFETGEGKAIAPAEEVLYKTVYKLPVAEKEGHVFLGWSDGVSEEYFTETYEVKADVTLTAHYAHTVTLDLNGGAIKGQFDTVDQVKAAFIQDLNAVLGTSYTVDTSFTWVGTAYEIFLDATYGAKWRPLLQYFYDVETAQKDTIVNPGKYPTAEYDLYEYWDELMAGQDLVEVAKDTAPYCVAFALQAWTKKILLETTYHFSADYSSDEVQNLVLDYFMPDTTTERHIEEGASLILPVCGKEGVGFNGFFEGDKYAGEVYTPADNVTLKAEFGGYALLNGNVAADDIDQINEEVKNVAVAEDGEAATLPALTRANYTFDGWYNVAGEKVETIDKTTGLISLTAKWIGDEKEVTFANGKNEFEGFEMAAMENAKVEYGKKFGTLAAATAEGFVFEGWFTKDGTDGDWGEAFDTTQIVREGVTVYAKFKQPYTVKLNYGDSLGGLNNVFDAREAFLTDFYNWCLAQNAFTAEEMTKEAFIGAAEGQLTFNGLWVQYSGAAGNPSSLFPVFDSATMKNFFMAPKGETGSGRECGVIENSTYFINDAAMNAKWGPYMAYVAEICNNASRAWGPEANNFFIYELGRTFLADDETFKGSYGASCVEYRKTLAPKGCEHLLVSKYAEAVEFTVYSLTSDNKLPVAAKEGYVFVGWTMGGKPYTYINDEALNGKELTPVFVENKAEADFVIKWASARQAAKEEAAISITNGTYKNGAVWPSAVYRDKVLLKYNAKGQLEVVAVGLNGVRISTNPSDSFYVEGQSNLEWDLIIIGYSADGDAIIKALGLAAGDIIEIAAANDVYDVLDGADPENWSPDHQVNVKAFITKAATPAA